MARYMGQVAVFRALVPLGKPIDKFADFPPRQLHRRAGPGHAGRSSAWCPRRCAPTASSCAASPSTCAAGCRRSTRSAPSWPTTRADKRARLIDRLLDCPGLRRLLRDALGQHPAQRQPGRLRAGGLRLPRLDPRHDRPQSALRRVRARHRRRRRRMAGRPGRQLVLADARRSAAPARRRHRPGLPRPASAVRQVPSSPLRTLEPGRLLRPGRLLLAPGPQGLRRAAAVLFGRAHAPPARSTRAPASRSSRSCSTAPC